MLAPFGLVSRTNHFISAIAALLTISMVAPPAYSMPNEAAVPILEQEDASLFSDLNLPTYVWNVPQNEPKGIVLGFHGACLHGRSYRTLAEKLATRGYMFVSYDMRGFGKWFHNARKKDKPFDHGQSYADGLSILKRLRESYPGVPIICVGESFGSFMALKVAQTNPGLLDGMILVSASTPRLFISPYMLKEGVELAFNPLKRLDLSHYLKRKLSHKKEAAQHEANDPLNRNAQSIAELVRSAYTILKTGRNADDVPDHVPVLVLTGDEDRLCNPKSAKKLFKKLPSAQKVFVQVPDHGHLMIETPFIEQRVENLIANWLDDTTNQKIASSRQDHLLAGSTIRGAITKTLSVERQMPESGTPPVFEPAVRN